MNRTREPQPLSKADLLSPQQLAELLSIPLATVYRWRSRGDGPMAMKLGRHVRYRMNDVVQWLDECIDHAPSGR